MKHRVVLLLISATLILGTGATSHSDESPGYEKQIETFFSLMAEGKSTEAIDGLYAPNPWHDRMLDAITNLRQSLSELPVRAGKYYGYQLLSTKQISDSLIYVGYLARYDRMPLRFEFVFYRPDKKWLIYSFSYDSELTTDLKASGRVEMFEH